MAQAKPTPANKNEKPAPARTGGEKPGWAVEAVRACRAIAFKLIGTGNAGILLVLAIVVSVIWRLTSVDLKEVLLAIFNSRVLAVLGWAGLMATIYISHRLLGAMRALHEKEVDHLTNQHGHEMERLIAAHQRELERLEPIAQPVAGSAQPMLSSKPSTMPSDSNPQ